MLCRLARALALCVLAAIGLPAAAQVGDVAILGTPAPFWVLHPNGAYATLDYDFVDGRYYQVGIGAAPDPKNLLTTTRASTGYASDSAGLFYSFANNTPRITNLGLLVEEARTNDALWSRDLTNAAWVKVGIGTALNATGIDGAANSATTLTGTGTAGSCTASCTALQTITLGSTADTYSVYLKRVTGSGTVNITINNLAGVTPCTLTTTGFTRCAVTATLANPVIGIQLTALNDVVIVDFNQLEPGGFATSPILTTSTTATRAADTITVKSFPTFGPAYTSYASGTPVAPLSYATNQVIIAVSNVSGTDRTQLTRSSGGNYTATMRVGGSNTYVQTPAAWGQNTFAKFAISIVSGSQQSAFSGTTLTGGTQSAIPSAPTQIDIGHLLTTSQFDGEVSRVTIWTNNALPASTLPALTSGGSP